jgi:hypothetical protein
MKRIFLLLLIMPVMAAMAQREVAIPVTPEAYSFIQNVERPIDLHTGAMSKSISLFKLEAKGLELDINLSYFSNGIKVNDIASRVGLGWSLNAARMISRQMNDYPDFENYWEDRLYEDGSLSEVDTRQDIFYYDIPGHKGRFIIEGSDADGYTAKQLNKEDVTITILNNGSNFLIVDESGIQYFYELGDWVVNRQTYWVLGGLAGDGDASFQNWHELGYPQNWYLTRIILTNGDEIKYNYSNPFEVNYEPTWGTQERLFHHAVLASGMQSAPGSRVQHNQRVNAKILNRIQYKTTNIDFYYNLSREDLPGDAALTEVRVTNNNQINKILYLDYEFVTSFDTHLTNSTNRPSSVFKRLFLTTIRQRGSFSGDEMTLFSFEYDDTAMPHRKSKRCDAWGYYNNYSQNDADDLRFPKIYIYPNSSRAYERYWPIPKPAGNNPQLIIDGRNMQPNTALAQAGLLKKIIYSTGGYSSIEYEPNEFLWFDESNTTKDISQAYNITGGGSRIKTITNVAPGSPDVVTSYKYNFQGYSAKTSGAIAYFPQYAYPFIGERAMADQGLYNLSYYEKILVRTMDNQNDAVDNNAHSVGYRQVTLEQQNNGKIIYRFGFPGAYSEGADNPSSCSNDLQGYCDNLFAPSPTTGYGYTLPEFPGLELQSTQPYTYPFLSNTPYDWNRGLPVKESYFDKNGMLLKDVDLKYNLFYNGEFLIDGDGKELGFFSAFYTYTKDQDFKFLLNCNKKVKEKTETIYSNGTSIVNKEEFVYGPNHMIPVETIKTNSFGKAFKTRLKYSGDYTGITAATNDENARALLKFQQKHILNTEVEKTVSQKNLNDEEKVIGSELNIFNINPLNNELLSLVETKRLETANGVDVTQFQQSSIINNALAFDAAYKPYIVNRYDGKGNLINTQKLNDVKFSYIWNDEGNRPIAQIVGAAENQVAYSSFELDQSGTWEGVDPAEATSGLGGPGPAGNRCYDGGSFTFSKRNLPGGTYIVSYWVRGAGCIVNGTNGAKIKTVGFWDYYEHEIAPNGANIIFVSGSNPIDELRLFPKSALMTTYTYKPNIGLLSTAGPNNHRKSYEYNTYGHLQLIRDEDQNVLQRFCYNFYNQANACEFATTAPFWQATGATRLKLCAGNNMYYSQMRQHQEIDINPQSSSYNTEQWIDDGIDNTADVSIWAENASTIRCKAGSTTSEVEKQETDVNPCSPGYLTTRWVDGGINTTACPAGGNNTIYARLEIEPHEPENTSSPTETFYMKTVAVYLRFYTEATCTNRIAVPRSINYSVTVCGYMNYLESINPHCYPNSYTGTAYGVSEINLADPSSFEGLWQVYDEIGNLIYMEKWVDDYELMSVDNNCVILPPLQPAHSPGF